MHRKEGMGVGWEKLKENEINDESILTGVLVKLKMKFVRKGKVI